jgi:hypothetical protein
MTSGTVTELGLRLETVALRRERRRRWTNRPCDACGGRPVAYECLFALAGDALAVVVRDEDDSGAPLETSSTLTKLGGSPWLCSACAEGVLAGDRLTLIAVAGHIAASWSRARRVESARPP